MPRARSASSSATRAATRWSSTTISKHAQASADLAAPRRPPGARYLGDVFYLHSRLLERAKLNDAKGGGSPTPRCRSSRPRPVTSAYIPTNVISITDGQIFLEGDLFPRASARHQRRQLGVARRRLAQIKRCGRSPARCASTWRGRELARSRVRRDLDSRRSSSSIGCAPGRDPKQGQHSPLPVAQQVVIIYAGNNGYLDAIRSPTSAMTDGTRLLHGDKRPGILQRIAEKKTSTTS